MNHTLWVDICLGVLVVLTLIATFKGWNAF